MRSLSRFRARFDLGVAFSHFRAPSLLRIDAPLSKLFPSNPFDSATNPCLYLFSDPAAEYPRSPLEPELIQTPRVALAHFVHKPSRFRATFRAAGSRRSDMSCGQGAGVPQSNESSQNKQNLIKNCLIISFPHLSQEIVVCSQLVPSSIAFI